MVLLGVARKEILHNQICHNDSLGTIWSYDCGQGADPRLIQTQILIQPHADPLLSIEVPDLPTVGI